MMSPLLWLGTPYKNQTAWYDFHGHHALWHRALAQVIVDLGHPVYAVFPLGDGGGPAWMQSHAIEHAGAAASLGLSAPPDLTNYDLTHAQDWASWHFIHSEEHERLRKQAGIA